MNKIKYYQIDAFADRQFKGNPAGVCLLDSEISVETMLNIAAENNLSETAFLVKRADGFGLRWFTPTVEVELCGHATLASAFVLWKEGIATENEPIKFYTQKAGVLRAEKQGSWIELNFPASFESERDLPEEVKLALNTEIVNAVWSQSRWIVELESPEAVRACKPDFFKLKSHEMVVITSKGDNQYDFVSRSFGPLYGIDEDPVTGSSHCCLATYWSKRLGKSDFFAFQSSARGGEVKIKLQGDRVLFAGQGALYLEGWIEWSDTE